VTAGFIAKLESGDTLPSYDVCVALTNVLHLSLEELWDSVQTARREEDARRLRTRGAISGGFARTRGPIRTRGPVRTRGSAAPAAGGGRGPKQIAEEIAADPELLAAYHHLRMAFRDPVLRTAVLQTLEALARQADRSAERPATSKKRD
jgi:hypothetical protein